MQINFLNIFNWDDTLTLLLGHFNLSSYILKTLLTKYSLWTLRFRWPVDLGVTYRPAGYLAVGKKYLGRRSYVLSRRILKTLGAYF